MPPARRNELISSVCRPRGEQPEAVGYHPNALYHGRRRRQQRLNFPERGWNGENFHEVTGEPAQQRSVHGQRLTSRDYRRAQADLQ